MSKHTPGPWSWYAYDGDEREKLIIHGASTYVGEIELDDCDGPSQNEISNARLIAAAPELLKACQEVLTWMPVGADRELQRVERMVSEAINKALSGSEDRDG